MENETCKQCNCKKICQKFKGYEEFECKSTMNNLFLNLDRLDEIFEKAEKM